MPDKKLTDSEKIEMLSNGKGNEYIITLVDEAKGKVERLTLSDIAYLINRLQAELFDKTEQLKTAKRELNLVLENSISARLPHCVLCGNGAIFTKSLEEYDELIADISAEAQKEFAERLKEYATYYSNSDGAEWFSVDVADIDNLLKELVGEDK